MYLMQKQSQSKGENLMLEQINRECAIIIVSHDVAEVLNNVKHIACDEAACGELTVDTYKYFLDIEKNQRL